MLIVIISLIQATVVCFCSAGKFVSKESQRKEEQKTSSEISEILEEGLWQDHWEAELDSSLVPSISLRSRQEDSLSKGNKPGSFEQEQAKADHHIEFHDDEDDEEDDDGLVVPVSDDERNLGDQVFAELAQLLIEDSEMPGDLNLRKNFLNNRALNKVLVSTLDLEEFEEMIEEMIDDDDILESFSVSEFAKKLDGYEQDESKTPCLDVVNKIQELLIENLPQEEEIHGLVVIVGNDRIDTGEQKEHQHLERVMCLLSLKEQLSLSRKTLHQQKEKVPRVIRPLLQKVPLRSIEDGLNLTQSTTTDIEGKKPVDIEMGRSCKKPIENEVFDEKFVATKIAVATKVCAIKFNLRLWIIALAIFMQVDIADAVVAANNLRENDLRNIRLWILAITIMTQIKGVIAPLPLALAGGAALSNAIGGFITIGSVSAGGGIAISNFAAGCLTAAGVTANLASKFIGRAAPAELVPTPAAPAEPEIIERIIEKHIIEKESVSALELATWVFIVMVFIELCKMIFRRVASSSFFTRRGRGNYTDAGRDCQEQDIIIEEVPNDINDGNARHLQEGQQHGQTTASSCRMYSEEEVGDLISQMRDLKIQLELLHSAQRPNAASMVQSDSTSELASSGIVNFWKEDRDQKKTL